MATVKKTAAEQGLQQKMKVLAKLFDAGCKTEKDLKALTLPTILKIPDVTVPDMTVITELQDRRQGQRLQILFGFTACVKELCQHLYFLLQALFGCGFLCCHRNLPPYRS